MILRIYFFILAYFFLGAMAFFFINRKKSGKESRQNWLKYSTYFLIIHVVFFSIVIHADWFRVLGLLIILVGWLELIHVNKQSGRGPTVFYFVSLFLYLVFSLGFFNFGKLPKETILFTFLVLSIFDAFSQLSGQLLGRHQLFPRVSPAKTLEGLVGGLLFAMGSAVLLRSITGKSVEETLLMAGGIVAFSFAGDFLASMYKRNYGVKDFSRLLPGQGGFLDRFDSLVAGGSFMALYAAFCP